MFKLFLNICSEQLLKELKSLVDLTSVWVTCHCFNNLKRNKF